VEKWVCTDQSPYRLCFVDTRLALIAMEPHPQSNGKTKSRSASPAVEINGIHGNTGVLVGMASGNSTFVGSGYFNTGPRESLLQDKHRTTC
jgi:hypothetical protein